MNPLHLSQMFQIYLTNNLDQVFKKYKLMLWCNTIQKKIVPPRTKQIINSSELFSSGNVMRKLKVTTTTNKDGTHFKQ